MRSTARTAKKSKVTGGAESELSAVDAAAAAAAHVAPQQLTGTTSECAAGAPGGFCSTRRVAAVIEAFAGAAGEKAGAAQELADTTVSTTQEPADAAAPARDAAAALPPAVAGVARVLGCDSESCVLQHPKFRDFAARRGVDKRAIERELATQFKPRGPRASTALLSNYDIDSTLRMWARADPGFHCCPFAMIDFDDTGEEFSQTDFAAILDGRAALDLGTEVVRRPATCFGCVLNTDTSRGPGKHWVAVFVDCRGRQAGSAGPAPWTVEYFNSAGRPPASPVVKWMERTRRQLEDYLGLRDSAAGNPAGPRSGEGLPESAPLRGPSGRPPVQTIAVTSINHQKSQTECGIYALYYIRRRLDGVPVSFFANPALAPPGRAGLSRGRIPDEAMIEFRTQLFRHH